MCSHIPVGWHLSQRYTQIKYALITHYCAIKNIKACINTIKNSNCMWALINCKLPVGCHCFMQVPQLSSQSYQVIQLGDRHIHVNNLAKVTASETLDLLIANVMLYWLHRRARIVGNSFVTCDSFWQWHSWESSADVVGQWQWRQWHPTWAATTNSKPNNVERRRRSIVQRRDAVISYYQHHQ